MKRIPDTYRIGRWCHRVPVKSGQWSIGHACTATQLWIILADLVRAANVSPKSLKPKVIAKYLKNAHARGERRTGSRLSHFNWYSLRYKWLAWILHCRLASCSIQVLPMVQVWKCGWHPPLAGSSKCGNNSKPLLPQRQSSGNWNRWWYIGMFDREPLPKLGRYCKYLRVWSSAPSHQTASQREQPKSCWKEMEDFVLPNGHGRLCGIVRVCGFLDCCGDMYVNVMIM